MSAFSLSVSCCLPLSFSLFLSHQHPHPHSARQERTLERNTEHRAQANRVADAKAAKDAAKHAHLDELAKLSSMDREAQLAERRTELSATRKKLVASTAHRKGKKTNQYTVELKELDNAIRAIDSNKFPEESEAQRVRDRPHVPGSQEAAGD
jgi:hypothetical protein